MRGLRGIAAAARRGAWLDHRHAEPPDLQRLAVLVPVQPLLTAKLGDEYAMPFIVPAARVDELSQPHLECRAALAAKFQFCHVNLILSRRHQRPNSAFEPTCLRQAAQRER